MFVDLSRPEAGVARITLNRPERMNALSMAAGEDFIDALQNATFGTAFLKQGLASDFGLSYQLSRLAGAANAQRIIYLDEVLTATEARALKRIGRVSPKADLEAEALRMAVAIARIPADARASMKRLLNEVETQAHDAVLDAEEASQITLVTSEGHAAAVDTFLAERPQQPKSGNSE